jgi:zinc transport system substrate-binding protein
MSLRLVKLLSGLVISAVFLSGCVSGKSPDRQASPRSEAGKLTIVTSFYPVYVATINVTKDIAGVEVINMTKPQTGCLHDYQLTPADMKTLEKADVFVVNGAGMEAFLDKAVKQQPRLKIVEASKGIPLLRDENGEENPHVWVSVSDAILQVRNIADQLAAVDQANAFRYRDNADAYVTRLEALKEKMHQALDGVKNRDMITFHEAFPYFAREFDLKIAAVIEQEPGSEPSPRELENTIKTVKDLKIKALFAEPQYPSAAAATIAAETGAKVYILDPAVSGEAGPDAGDDYIEIMEQNLITLQEALK